MIALLVIIYVAVVLVLFKVLGIKPTAFRIAGLVLTGVLMIGGVVVAWMLSSPISEKLVTSQYVVQLVPYVKGQVKVVHAQVNQPIKKGEILLEIDPTPYQYTVNQIQASLEQAKAAVANAKANLNKAIAADELAKIKETNGLGTQRQYAGAISTQDVAIAVQSRLEADAAVQQAQAAVAPGAERRSGCPGAVGRCAIQSRSMQDAGAVPTAML